MKRRQRRFLYEPLKRLDRADKTMGCLTIWIKPDRPLEDFVKLLDTVFDIPLSQHATTQFDEHPGYVIDWDDDDIDVFIRVLGVPKDIDFLESRDPINFDIRDRQYEITICAHSGIPMQVAGGLNLPYSSMEEMRDAIVAKLVNAGLLLYEGLPPRIR